MARESADEIALAQALRPLAYDLKCRYLLNLVVQEELSPSVEQFAYAFFLTMWPDYDEELVEYLTKSKIRSPWLANRLAMAIQQFLKEEALLISR